MTVSLMALQNICYIESWYQGKNHMQIISNFSQVVHLIQGVSFLQSVRSHENCDLDQIPSISKSHSSMAVDDFQIFTLLKRRGDFSKYKERKWSSRDINIYSLTFGLKLILYKPGRRSVIVEIKVHKLLSFVLRI